MMLKDQKLLNCLYLDEMSIIPVQSLSSNSGVCQFMWSRNTGVKRKWLSAGNSKSLCPMSTGMQALGKPCSVSLDVFPCKLSFPGPKCQILGEPLNNLNLNGGKNHSLGLPVPHGQMKNPY